MKYFAMYTCSTRVERWLCLQPIFGLYHDDRVSSDDHHADVVFVTLLGVFDGIVQHEIHKRIESAQSPLTLRPPLIRSWTFLSINFGFFGKSNRKSWINYIFWSDGFGRFLSFKFALVCRSLSLSLSLS